MSLFVAAVPFKFRSDPARLVHSLKDKPLIISLEYLRDLCPGSGHNSRSSFLVVFVWVIPFLMVHIEYNVKVVVVGIVYHLLYPGHPVLGYVVVLVHMISPACGYSHRIEARFLYRKHHFLGGFGISPAFFGGNILCARCVEGISEIPAHLYAGGKLKACHGCIYLVRDNAAFLSHCRFVAVVRFSAFFAARQGQRDSSCADCSQNFLKHNSSPDFYLLSRSIALCVVAYISPLFAKAVIFARGIQIL